MSEQTPSASKEALEIARHIRLGVAGFMRDSEGAKDIDALIAQCVSAETERWQNRDRQRLGQIARLQETVQSFQSASAGRPAPEGPQPKVAAWLQEQLDASAAETATWPEWKRRELQAEIEKTPDRRIVPSALASTGEQPEDGTKLWLWKNGDHYLAYANEYPTYGGGDPMTLGEPAGVAFFKTSTPAGRAEFVRCLRCVSHELARDVCWYAGRCVRAALQEKIAEQDAERGRPLTDRERMDNLAKFMGASTGEQSAPEEEPRCEGGVPLGTMGATCPKCGATDNDLCGYLFSAEPPTDAGGLSSASNTDPSQATTAAPSRHLTPGEQSVMKRALVRSTKPVSPPAAVVDYTEPAREILRKLHCWRLLYHDARPIDDPDVGQIAAALSTVASEHDAAAIRAFGKRVWSDTEEVAYQAGVSDALARLQEPAVREAVAKVYGDGPIPWDAIAEESKDVLRRQADRVIARIEEMLKP